MRLASPIATIVIGSAMLLTGACTTVDMTGMGSMGAGANVAQSSGPNVVEKATAKLFALFTSRGWSTHDSRKRMESAANMLLNGLDTKRLSHDPSGYVDTVASRDALVRDMLQADDQIEQTIKAAEVFLAMTEAGDDVRDELADLEQALLASRQAQKLFTAAADVHGATDELSHIEDCVDRLRDVTDEFGRRVRRAQNRNVAAVSGSRVAF